MIRQLSLSRIADIKLKRANLKNQQKNYKTKIFQRNFGFDIF